MIFRNNIWIVIKLEKIWERKRGIYVFEERSKLLLISFENDICIMVIIRRNLNLLFEREKGWFLFWEKERGERESMFYYL